MKTTLDAVRKLAVEMAVEGCPCASGSLCPTHRMFRAVIRELEARDVLLKALKEARRVNGLALADATDSSNIIYRGMKLQEFLDNALALNDPANLAAHEVEGDLADLLRRPRTIVKSHRENLS